MWWILISGVVLCVTIAILVRYAEESWLWVAIAVLVWAFFAVISFGFFFGTTSEYGEMHGILYSLPAYKKTVDDTGDITYAISENEMINAAEIGIGKAKSERMAEMVTRIDRYNHLYGVNREFYDTWWGRLWMPAWPEDLKPLIITK
ncbi:hypothetical protein M0R72_06455 [Candidatus Pacearchaeota archaeon]|jgi:hypothetical protein|nr:hypothetical protein [Candidatus Pacearchaeota archaeon]